MSSSKEERSSKRVRSGDGSKGESRKLKRTYTDTWVVWHSYNGGKRVVVASTHDTLEQANEAAKRSWDQYDSAGMDSEVVNCDEEGLPYDVFRCVDYGSGSLGVSVEELELDSPKIPLARLKVLCTRHGLSPTGAKKTLIDRLRPVLDALREEAEANPE